MGTIRTPLSRQAPQPIPGTVRPAMADPKAFGAGIANAGMNLGQQMMKIDEEEKVKDDAMMVQEQYASFLDKKRDFLYGENGLYTKQGRDASNIHKDLEEFYRTTGATFARNLGNREQQDLWSKALLGDRDSDLNKAMTYRQEQITKARDNAFKSTLTAKQEEAIASMDPDVVDEAREFGFFSIEQQFQGQDAETIDAAKAEYMSGIHTKIIERLLDNGQGEAARVYLQEYGGEILGSEKAEIEKDIRANVLAEKAYSKGQELFNRFGLDGEQRAREFVEKNYKDLSLKSAIIEQMEAYYVDQRRYHEVATAGVTKGFLDKIKNSTSLAEAEAVFMAAPEADKSAIRAAIDKKWKLQVSDRRVLMTVEAKKRLYLGDFEGEEGMALFYGKYEPYLSESDAETVLQGITDKVWTKPRTEETAVLNDFKKRHFKNLTKKGTSEAYGQFETAVLDQIDRRERALRRKLEPHEIRILAIETWEDPGWGYEHGYEEYWDPKYKELRMNPSFFFDNESGTWFRVDENGNIVTKIPTRPEAVTSIDNETESALWEMTGLDYDEPTTD